MRIYVIGNDGITLCREPLATVNEGEIAVTSKEELQAAPLSGKPLLALWNEALPNPEPEPQSDAKRQSKRDEVITMLRRPEGATVDEVANAMGW
jgi:hypothetical protein